MSQPLSFIVLSAIVRQNLCYEFANNEITALFNSLASTTGSTLLELDSPFSQLPKFGNPMAGDYSLTAANPLIDKGIVVCWASAISFKA